MRLERLVTMRTGVNQLRLAAPAESDMYSYGDLLADLGRLGSQAALPATVVTQSQESYQLAAGDIVFSVIRNTAAIVSAATAGKVINQNFVRWRVIDDAVDRRYLCYCLNQSDAIKRQLAKYLEGSNVANKLSLKSLRALDIPVLPVAQQRLWGQLYFNVQRQAVLQQRVLKLQGALLTGMEQQVK